MSFVTEADYINVPKVRELFPACKSDQKFFDNAGGSHVPETVISSIANYLSNTNVQLFAGYATSKTSTEKVLKGLDASAKFINAPSGDNIALGGSTTQLLANLSMSIDFKPEDEIIVSEMDHAANISSWVRIAESHNLVLKWWTVEKGTTEFSLETLKGIMTPKTRLVAVTHTSNLLGNINPVKEISKVVHQQPNAMLCVDGVAHAPHRRIDVQELGVDFYAFSWYKVFGPHISCLYASPSALKGLKSLAHSFNTDGSLLGKVGLAACNYELAQTIPYVLDYFGGLESLSKTFDAIANYEEDLCKVFMAYLQSKPDIFTLYGPPSPSKESRVPIFSFTVKGFSSEEIVNIIESTTLYGLRAGHLYSYRLVKNALGLSDDGCVRVSLLHYNTVEEVEGFIKVLDGIVENKATTTNGVNSSTLSSKYDDLYKVIDTERKTLWDLSQFLYKNPELKHEEFKAHEYMTKLLESAGFNVTREAYGLKTAFKAEFNNKKSDADITVAFNAEYDALPGIGTHACGHNLIAASSVGSAIAVKEYVAKYDIPAAVLCLGTPAEENGGGKITMLENGAYKQVDITLMAHPSNASRAFTDSVAGMTNIDVKFKGKSAHQGISPWKGVNALDALVLAYNNLSVLRQQLLPTDRIGLQIVDGGKATNVIPDVGILAINLRSSTSNRVYELRKKFDDCINAAALATGCTAEIKMTGWFYADMRTNEPMARLYSQHLNNLGSPLTESEAEQKSQSFGGGTDQGNVSHEVPSIHPVFDIGCPDGCHTPAFAEKAGTEYAFQQAMITSKAMAGSAMDVILDADKLKEVKKDYEEMKKKFHM